MDSPLDALQAVTHPDPWPWYERLARERPFGFDPRLGLWVAAGARAVREALAHPRLRVRPPAEPVPRQLLGTPAGEVFALLVRMNDGAFHAAHRPAVDARLRVMQPSSVAEAAAACAAELACRASPDALCAALSVRTVARLLGVRPDELDDTTALVQQFAQAIAPGADAASIRAGSDAARRLMAQGEAEGLDRPDAANRIALMQQALDATWGLMAASSLRLQHEPVLADSADASLPAMRAFVAEVARRDPPIHNTRRFASDDITFCGERLREGDGLLLVLAAAGRDPSPADLGFGAGVHRCPGERIAVEIAAAALRQLRQHHGWRQFSFRRTGWRPLPNARIPLITS